MSVPGQARVGVFAKCKCGLVIHSKSRHPWIPKRSTAASTSRAPPQLFTALSSYPLHVRRFLSRLPYLLFYYHYCSLSILLFSATILFTVSTYSIRACPQQFLHPFLVAVLGSFIGSGHDERRQEIEIEPRDRDGVRAGHDDRWCVGESHTRTCVQWRAEKQIQRIRISFKCAHWLAAQIVRSSVCTYVHGSI